MKKNCIITIIPLLFFAFVLMAPSWSAAQPVLINQRASLGGNDFIDWSVLGPDSTVVPAPFFIQSSLAGVGATVFVPPNPIQPFLRLDQGIGWLGNFSPGDPVLWTFDQVGPLAIEFDVPVKAAGAQIQANLLGPFTATLTVFEPGAIEPIATFTVDGLSTGDGDGSAIFLGAKDDCPVIKRIEYSVNSLGNDFAVNQVDLVVADEVAPGPQEFLNSKARFTFFYSPPSRRMADYASVTGHLLTDACAPCELPFYKNVTVTITVPDPDRPWITIPLFTQTIPAGKVKHSLSKYRYTSSRSGINELTIQCTCPGKVYLYLYIGKLDLLPWHRSNLTPQAYLDFVRRIKSYNFTVDIDGDTWTGSAPLIKGDFNEYKQQLVFGP